MISQSYMNVHPTMEHGQSGITKLRTVAAVILLIYSILPEIESHHTLPVLNCDTIQENGTETHKNSNSTQAFLNVQNWLKSNLLKTEQFTTSHITEIYECCKNVTNMEIPAILRLMYHANTTLNGMEIVIGGTLTIRPPPAVQVRESCNKSWAENIMSTSEVPEESTCRTQHQTTSAESVQPATVGTTTTLSLVIIAEGLIVAVLAIALYRAQRRTGKSKILQQMPTDDGNIQYTCKGAAAVKSEENTENKDDGDIPPLSRGVTGSGRKPRGLTLATSQSVADHKQAPPYSQRVLPTPYEEVMQHTLGSPLSITNPLTIMTETEENPYQELDLEDVDKGRQHRGASRISTPTVGTSLAEDRNGEIHSLRDGGKPIQGQVYQRVESIREMEQTDTPLHESHYHVLEIGETTPHERNSPSLNTDDTPLHEGHYHVLEIGETTPHESDPPLLNTDDTPQHDSNYQKLTVSTNAQQKHHYHVLDILETQQLENPYHVLEVDSTPKRGNPYHIQEEYDTPQRDNPYHTLEADNITSEQESSHHMQEADDFQKGENPYHILDPDDTQEHENHYHTLEVEGTLHQDYTLAVHSPRVTPCGENSHC